MSSHRLYSSFSKNSLNLNEMNSKTSDSVMQNSSPASKTTINKSPSTSGVQNISKKKHSRLSHNENVRNNSFDFTILDSDSSSNDPDFFSKVNRRLPYTVEEDEIILKFVLKGENIYKVGSISLWKELEDKKVCPKRTFQSLKNRFTRNIVPLIFSKYKYLIEDEDTINKVLAKFPELKRKIGQKKALSIINLPERNKGKINSNVQEELRFSCKRPIESLEEKHQIPNLNSKKLMSNINIFGDGRHKKRIEFKNNSISISFKKGVYAPEKNSIQKIGIYEKFLQLKKNNPLVPCSQCGRPTLTSEICEKTENEEDLIIPASLNESQKGKKKKNSKKLTPLSNGNSEKEISNNFSTFKTDSLSSESPSLLDNISEELLEAENNISNKEVIDVKSTPMTYKLVESQKTSQLFYEDEDLDLLYRETAARCRQLIDSEETQEEENEIASPTETSQRRTSKAVGVHPVSPSRKSNPESFFLTSDSPQSETPSCQGPSKFPKKKGQGQEKAPRSKYGKNAKKVNNP